MTRTVLSWRFSDERDRSAPVTHQVRRECRQAGIRLTRTIAVRDARRFVIDVERSGASDLEKLSENLLDLSSRLHHHRPSITRFDHRMTRQKRYSGSDTIVSVMMPESMSQPPSEFWRIPKWVMNTMIPAACTKPINDPKKFKNT
jgi:hypothetical protein